MNRQYATGDLYVCIGFEARAALLSRNPQRRLMQPEEVANAALWLCLTGAEAITGQAIAVAGGEVL